VQPAEGIASFIGYEYQILATVWTGLDLIVRRAVCDHIVVEPVSEEDIAAQLDEEQASATLKLPNPRGYPVEIQIKLRRSGHWTPSMFGQVLSGSGDGPGTRGPSRRIRPIQNLINTPHLRFAMITDARMNDELLSFRVGVLGEHSNAVELPHGLNAPNASEVACRIGVLTECSEEVLRLRIGECLRHAHVPSTKQEDCIEQLRQVVKKRLLGEMPNEWNRKEIESILTNFDGFPERRTLSPLVPPNNYEKLQSYLATQNVLLITGPPGAGKTHTASHLVHEYRLHEDPYEVVEVQGGDGIGKVRERLDDQGRVLFFIHDPWGLYKATERSQEWATELPRIVGRANVGKKFLITSRTAIKEEFMSAEFRNKLSVSNIAISEENFDETSRELILEHALAGAGHLQTDFAAKHQQRIISQLRLPLAIESFAQSLTTFSMPPEPSLEALIGASNIEVIAHKVQQEVESQGDTAIASATILWALFSLRQVLRLEEVQLGRKDARQGRYIGQIDPEKLFEHFVRSKRVSQSERESFYAHPTFIEGLERIVEANPGIADDVLSALLTGMCENNRIDKVQGILRHLRQRNTPIPTSAQNALNSYLLEQLNKVDQFDGSRLFRNIADYFVGNDPVAILIRTLMSGAHRSHNGMPLGWRLKPISESDSVTIRDSKAALESAKAFVRFAIIDFDGERYRACELVAFFNGFGWDLTPQFLEALTDSLEQGASNSPMLAEAALLGSQPPYDEVLAMGLDGLDYARQSLGKLNDEYRRAEQGELNGEHSSHIFDQADEQPYGPERVIKVAVVLRRSMEGYDWLICHPRIADLIETWVDTIEAGTSDDEIKAVIATCSIENRHLGWRAIWRARASTFAPQLFDALLCCPANELVEVIRAITVIVPPGDWQSRVIPSLASQSLQRRLQIASALQHPSIQHNESSVSDIALQQIFQPSEMRALEACFSWEGPESIRDLVSSFAEAEAAVLRELTTLSGDAICVKAALVLHQIGEVQTASLDRWINSPAVNTRFYAYHLAGLSRSDVGMGILRFNGVNDSDYRCRRVSLGYLASHATEESWAHVLQAANDRSGPIRECCARLIAHHHYQNGEQTLRSLIRDTRDISEDHHLTIYGGCDFHVARAAAQALNELPHLSPETIADMINFVVGGADNCADWVVHYHLVNCLAWRELPDCLPFFIEGLGNQKFLSGPKRSGFPIRYAAAWGVANLLGATPELANTVKLEKVLSCSLHPDPRLAGPCIIALGFVDPRMREAFRNSALKSEDPSNRIVLYQLAATYSQRSPNDEFARIIGMDHPASDIANFLNPAEPIAPAIWREWLGQRPTVKSWIEGLQTNDGFNAALRYLLWLHTGQGECEFVNPVDLQANDLAEGSPLITTRKLFGGE
jgi:hypothetical protein